VIRSLEIIDNLAEENEVFVTSASRAHSFLKKQTPDKVKPLAAIQTIELCFGENTFDLIGTAYKNIPKLPAILYSNWKIFDKLKKNVDLVISDHEVSSVMWAKANRKKIINISHTHGMYFTHFFEKFKKPLNLAYTVPLDLLSTADMTVNTHFFPLKRKSFLNVRFFGPIIAKDMIEVKATEGKKIVVYLPTNMLNGFIEVANPIKEKFIVFCDSGQEKLKKTAGKNFSFKKVSRKNFVKELSRAKCFVSHGGVSGLTEALFLGKPCYVIADESFYERCYNGKTMELLGYGKCSKKESGQEFTDFLHNIKQYKKELQKKPVGPANKEIIAFIKKQIESGNTTRN